MEDHPPAADPTSHVATATTAQPAPPAPDVALVFDDGTHLLAHCSILSLASPVFADLLLACCCDDQHAAANVAKTSDQCGQGHAQLTAPVPSMTTGTQKSAGVDVTAGAAQAASSSKDTTLGWAGSLHAAALLRAAGNASADDSADMPCTEPQPFFQSAAEAAPPADPVTVLQGTTVTAAASVTAQPSYSMQSAAATSETSSAAPSGRALAKVPMIGDSPSAWCELLAFLYPPPVGATTGRPLICWVGMQSACMASQSAWQ
jgi:hypothetical protein